MSEENSNLAEIQKHREQIDEIDREIVALLNKRAGHSAGHPRSETRCASGSVRRAPRGGNLRAGG